ncbi:hypothetical protein MASR1M90_23310 [Desulfovibrionales bacterium]
MITYKEFQAKTVDQAIEDACRYFATSREALEIDIIHGGSAGIFGLGAKKALVRVRKRAPLTSAVPEVADSPVSSEMVMPEPQPVSAAKTPSAHLSVPAEPPAHENISDNLEDLDDFDEDEESNHTVQLLSDEDKASLESVVKNMMRNLLQPICPNSTLTVQVTADTIRVHIADEENSGLIIGRDGHTIAALQYVANRILAKTWPNSARIQLDAGEYRQKQTKQLERIALALSEKAKKSGKVQSTKPLSSYHRRIVHVVLQPDRHVQTRSKGDGPLKRVLIVPAKRHKSDQRTQRSQAAVSSAQHE